MKILLFSYYFHPDIGGIESISKMLAGYFTNVGHEVHILTKTKSKGQVNFPFEVIRNPSFLIVLKELRWADIVFENNPCFSMSYPNFLMRKPSVISLQTWLETLQGEYDTRQKLKHRLLKNAKKVVACSQAISKSFNDAVVIPNPYNGKLFRVKKEIEKTKDFIFLGRLVSDKGADMAIKALHQVLQDFDTNITIVGDGDEMPALKKLVQQLGLQYQVRFAGSLQGEELVDCLNEHRFLVAPSVWKEPFGIVALEGLACGCIPIVSDGGGLPEAAGGNGMVFKRGNVDELAACMMKALQTTHENILDNPGVKQHLHAHTIPVIAEKYLQLFQSVLEKN